MKLAYYKTFWAIVLLCISTYTKAQIIAPDSVSCMDTTKSISATINETENIWIFDTTDVTQLASYSVNYASVPSALSTPVYSSMNNDNGTWYSFVTSYNNHNLIRLNYGNNPLSTPVSTNLGVLGVSSGKQEGIQIIKDGTNWYGFVVENTQLLRLSFGTSLGNTPTATVMNMGSAFAWPHQVGIAKYGNEWVGFVANRSGRITRLDFGTSITSTPTPTLLPVAGGYSNPCNFALHKQNGNWYMIVVNLINGTLTRLNLGTNIKNNSPTGILLGNPGGLLKIPRTIAIVQDCDRFVGYIINEAKEFIKLDFNNDITNTPTATNLGSFATGITQLNAFTPFSYNGTLYFQALSVSQTNNIYQRAIHHYNTPNSILYNTSQISPGFIRAGQRPYTLLQNTGHFMGSGAYCKNMYIKPGDATFLNDAAFCAGDSTILDASITNASGYLWSTGATTPSITAKTTGTYWVTLTGGDSCFRSSDTAIISTISINSLNLGADKTICAGETITLANTTPISGVTYKWNTGSAQQTLTVSTAGVYWLEAKLNSCVSSDTVEVFVTPIPQVNLGNDTFFCSKDTLTLRNLGAIYPTATYTWDDSIVANTLKVSKTGAHRLKIAIGNCFSEDTILLVAQPEPEVDLGPDTAFCDGLFFTLESKSPLNGANTFIWNNGFSAAAINISIGGTYWMEASINGKCANRDTIVVTVNPSPDVFIGADTVICRGDSIMLNAMPQPAGTLFAWSNNSSNNQITVSEQGAYSVNVTNSYDCTESDTILVTVIETPEVVLINDTLLCNGDILELYAGIFSGVDYAWNDGSKKDRIYVTQPGTYYVRVSNKCGIGYDEVVVDYENCEVWLPSAFSPNGDGLNDYAHLLGNIHAISNYRLSIYNRWGERIYYTEDVKAGWDGKWKGTPQQLNTYFYLVQYKFRDKERMLKGDITLVK